MGRNNFGKAAYEMFGIGSGREEDEKIRKAGGRGETQETSEALKPVEEKEEVPEVSTEELDKAFLEVMQKTQTTAPTPAPAPEVPRYQTTILAEGSEFEGVLRAKGSVDLACKFKGDIFADGDVVMRTSLEGNVEGNCVELISCRVQGDISAKAQVKVHKGSSIKGSIMTRDITCSGQVDGDIVAEGHVILEQSARLIGNLTAATLSIEEGAMIEGNLKVVRSGMKEGKKP